MIMNTFEDFFPKYAGKITDTTNDQESTFIQYCKIISSIITDSFYVLDIVQKQFCYIKPDDLFLCGHSVEEAMTQGYDFYSQIIHPEDLPLWNNFLEIIPQYLKDLQGKQDTIDYISCTFRLIRNNSFMKDPLSQMVYQKMIPVWKNKKIGYLICSVESVAYKKNGFYLHYKNSLTYEKYEPAVGSWSTHTMSFLNERERILLNLSRQGLNSNDISETLCRSKHTIQNQIKALFTKLDVHSMQEAVERANHCNLLYPYKEKKVGFPNETIHTSPQKIEKKLMYEIQILLDKGKSIRSIASMIGIAESTIRSWIIKKLLKK